MPSTRPNRFHAFHPLHSSLRTAFSPTRSSRSPSTSSVSTSASTSPLSRTSSPHSHTHSHSSHRRSDSVASIRHLLALRRKPSVLEWELLDEKLLFTSELDLLEPRPGVMGLEGQRGADTHLVGIFEVLDGKC
ncbi:hypothetical protein ACEQ8H_001869 [Pleosporales sp. CAS-2024a]